MTRTALLALLFVTACKGDKEEEETDDPTGDDTGGSPTDDTGGDTDDTGTTDDTGDTQPVEITLPDDFERYCGERDWEATSEEAALGDEHGDVRAGYSGLPEGTGEAMSYVPEQPFYLTTLRVWFARGDGTARLRVMTDFGGSYADIENEEADLIEPIDLEVTDEMLGDWIDVDVSNEGVFLHPTQKYFLVYEHLDSTPRLAMEDVADGDTYRSALWYESSGSYSWYAVGDDDGYYNYRMELGGYEFCTWEEADKWFSEQEGSPWEDVSSQRATITDYDGDGDDDLVLNSSGPLLYENDGTGAFTEIGDEIWPEADYMAVMVFGDVDNDGDVDAVGLSWVEADYDYDGYYGGVDGDDCNDDDDSVYPGAKELDDGYDNDCDGIADDGTDTSDADADGVTIADGDCDDTRDDVYPGAEEEADKRDNDCDLVTDEDFTNRVLLNDGAGSFEALDCTDFDKTNPTGGGALGDGNGDGWLDIYYGNWLEKYPYPPSVPDAYLEGDGTGCFTDAAEAAGVTSAIDPDDALACYGVVWVDYNNDSHQDIFVSNYGYDYNLLFENQGDGTFDEVGEEKNTWYDWSGLGDTYGGNTFGADWGDFDNDGDMDLISTDIAHPRYQPSSDITQLMTNSGPPDYEFTDVREEMGVAYDEGDVNASFADWDNDGDLDLMITSLYTGHYSQLYRNDGDYFTDVTFEAGTWIHDSVSNAWADFDHDGDLDVVVSDRTSAPYVHLFINELDNGYHWLEFKLEGTLSNSSGIGARVTVTADGVSRIREVKGGGGHSGNQHSLVAHFGLGESDEIDSVTVQWPSGGLETFTGVEVDGRYLLVEASGAASEL